MGKSLFNDGWQFVKLTIGAGLEGSQSSDAKWSEVDLPHDWLIHNTHNLYEEGEGWYRKAFHIEDCSDKVISICFEGVYMNSTVYINNTPVGDWKYGYSSFEFDITDYLKSGENEIKVRVIHQSPNSRWYSGAGIYRNVWLKTTVLTHLVTNGIYVSSTKTPEGWYTEIETEAISKDKQQGNTEATIKHTILDQGNKEIATSSSNTCLIGELTIDKQILLVKDPILWSLEQPYLYLLKTEVILDGVTVDVEQQALGYKTVRFDQNEGFYLNDKYVKLHGSCEHHDLGALGAAMNRVALKRELTLLKEMGINAIRTSHNMPAVELMELADEMGILIVSESFDMWERPKTQYDYARFFPEWCEKDVASWIRRDRNHPSIIMWSIGNEIYDTHVDSRGLEVTKLLRELVRKHDPKKNGLITIGSNYMSSENAQKCSAEVDAAGFNYAENLYEEHHRKYPDWIIYGSETASTLQSRGIYHFPASKVLVTHDDQQCSSLANCSTSWGAKSTQKNIIDDRDAKYCLGQFIWTGFDYIGEPTPYSTKNSYFGHIDTAGFPKDTFYLYQAEWTDYKVKPMVHLLPFWDFNVGQMIDIRIYSNAPKTELFFNDKSLGVFEIDHKKGKKLSGEWQLPYEPGTIKAVAYDEKDNILATDIQSSFGDAAKLILKPNKAMLQADGLDLIFVEIAVEDQDGHPVANANNRVNVEVTGAGRLIGLDNGNSDDFDQYKGTSRRLFSGKLLAIIAAKLEPGDIKMKVTSVNLQSEEIVLKAVPGNRLPGITALMENTKSEFNDEIPIRKIELTNQGRNRFGKDYTSTKVSAVIYPVDATYRELVWSVLTVGGIETNIAKVEVEGSEATVTALGDGEFRLRCTAANGSDHPVIVSEFEFEVTGMGEASLNPYRFVSAGLYSLGNASFDSGLLGGIVALGDGRQSIIGFSGLDFGAIGSDEITLPINYWGSDHIPIEIWEGIAGEQGAELLLRSTYQADSIWNTYQPNTYQLPKRLKGMSTLSIVLFTKVDVQGFSFAEYPKAYEKLSAKDNNRIYGDTFTITGEAIEHIGNNVNLEFDAMDFGSEGASKLIICGRSHTERNTIHILFQKEDSQVNQMIEFPYSEDYVEKEFNLGTVEGNQKVGFVFLPGCNFDFQWFRFEK